MPSQPPPLLSNRYPRSFHQNSSLLETHFSLPAPAHTDDAVETPHPTKSAVLSTPCCDRVTSCPTFPLELTLSATPRVKRELPARAPVRLQLPSQLPASPENAPVSLPPQAITPGGGADPGPPPRRTSPRCDHPRRRNRPGPNPSTYLASRLPRSPHFRRWSSGEELPIQAHLPDVPRLAAIINLTGPTFPTHLASPRSS